MSAHDRIPTIDPLDMPAHLTARLRERSWWLAGLLFLAALGLWWVVGRTIWRLSRAWGDTFEALSYFPAVFLPALLFLARERIEAWLRWQAYQRAAREGRWPE